MIIPTMALFAYSVHVKEEKVGLIKRSKILWLGKIFHQDSSVRLLSRFRSSESDVGQVIEDIMAKQDFSRSQFCSSILFLSKNEWDIQHTFGYYMIKKDFLTRKFYSPILFRSTNRTCSRSDDWMWHGRRRCLNRRIILFINVDRCEGEKARWIR